MSEHTKTPWHVNHDRPDDRDSQLSISNGDARIIANVVTCDSTHGWEGGSTNAAFIVKAVNNYDALVEALAGYERFITIMHEMAGENGYKSGIALAQERCRKELDRIDSVMSQVKVAVGNALPSGASSQLADSSGAKTGGGE